MNHLLPDAGSHTPNAERGFARFIGVESDGTVIVQMIRGDGKVLGFAALPAQTVGSLAIGTLFVVTNFHEACAALHVIGGPPQG